MRVQWHFKDGGCAAGGGSAGTGFKSFPVGPPRLVEVNVRVDDARENCQAARVDFEFRRARQISSDRIELSVTDSDVLLAAANEQIEIAHVCGSNGAPQTRS